MDQRDQELAQRIGDYLDERLSPEERAAFEATVRREPRLGQRLAELRLLRDAIRGADAELPPGFAARSRDRFEASRSRAAWRLPRFAIPAATAVAVAALIAVSLLERAPELARAPDSVVRVAAPEPDRAGSTDATEQAGTPDDPSAPVAEAPPSREERGMGHPTTGAVAGLQSQRVRIRAVGLPAGLMDEARPTATSEAQAPSKSSSRVSAPAEAAPAPPPTQSAPDVVVVIVARADAAAWNRLTSSPAGRALAAQLAPDFRLERVLLLAPTPSNDCDGITIERAGDALLLRLPPRPEARAESFAGCAVVVPAGPEPIRIAP